MNTKLKTKNKSVAIANELAIGEVLQIACDTIKDFYKDDLVLTSVALVESHSSNEIKLYSCALNDSLCKTKSKKNSFIEDYQKVINGELSNTGFGKSIESAKAFEEDINNLQFRESDFLEKKGVSYRALYPLICPNTDNVLGSLDICFKEKGLHNFPSEVIEKLTLQLAAAVENNRSYLNAKRNAERSMHINKLFYEINKTQNLDTIITNSVNKLGEIMDCSRCFFAGIALDDWIIQAEYAKEGVKKILGLTGPVKLGLFVVEDSITDGYVIVSDVDRQVKPKSEKLYEIYQKLEVKSFIYLPIRMKGKVCGILGLSQQDYNRKWTPEEIEILETVRDQVSSSITQAQLINDLKSSNERLLELDRLKSQLMSTVSHELRTPMANILGFSELLLHRQYSPDISKQYLTEIYGASQRLSNLIQDFLDLSRIEATGKIPLGQFEEIEIDWLAENSWNQTSNQQTNHKIEWEVSDDVPAILADPEGITRVFNNLFSNAIKYSEPGSTIKCRIEANRNDIFVCVEDQGSGIPTDLIPNIFDRFFRVDNTDTRKIGGTGLGLSICKEIINAHKGQIWCESKESEGTKFLFTLPLHVGDREGANEAQIWLS